MKKILPFIGLVTIMIYSSISYANAADAAKGKKVYNKCRACHTLAAGKHRIGPSLNGVLGRKAGTAEKYRYSKAMVKAGVGGLVWDEKTLGEYLKKPRAFIKGTKMVFPGLKKPTDLANLIAFLKQAAK
ncbi:MAG: cytochrome c family protein [Pseudomonadota bacterium]|nr:cytochrome c family protein [Pseudomonadota bacterium]